MSFQSFREVHKTWSIAEKYQINVHRSFVLAKAYCFFLNADYLDAGCTTHEHSAVFSHIVVSRTKNQTFGQKHQCTVLLMTNLAHVQWVSVDCSLQLVSNIVCVSNQSKYIGHNQQEIKVKACKARSLMFQDECYVFLWYHMKINIPYVPSKCHQTSAETYTTRVNHLQIIFDAVFLREMVFLFFNKSSKHFTKLIYAKVWMSIKFDEEGNVNETAQGWIVCHSHVQNTSFQHQSLFRCSTKQFILTMFLCDNINNCGKNSDELICRCNKTYQKHIDCHYRNKCSPLYFMDKTGICISYQNHSDISSKKGQISQIWKKENEKKIICEQQNQLPCSYESSECFSFPDICVYRIDALSNLVPCKYGSNLQYCAKFQCSFKFKCPKFYCIPWGYLCNARWDCPHGSDEKSDLLCGRRICESKMQCKNSQICISVHDVCDGQTDCPEGDDELLCEIFNTKCPTHCTCLNLAILCQNVSLGNNFMLRPQPYVAYHLESCLLSNLAFLLQHIEILNLTRNLVTNICSLKFTAVTPLKSIDGSHNLITKLTKSCFSNLSQITFLGLPHNNISFIEERTFINLAAILSINLESNKINILPCNIFHKIYKLAVLNLVNNPLSHLEMALFAETEIETLLATTFEICCTKPKAICRPTVPRPWYISCCRLQNKGTSTVYICVSVLVFVVNICSACFFLIKSKGPYASTVVSIDLVHILVGIYLVLIWSADLHHAENYIFRLHGWMNTATCATAFELLTGFVLILPILMSFLSLSILMVTKHPLDSQFKSTSHVKRWICCIILLNLLVSLGIILTWRFVSDINSSLCMPFEDPAKRFWQTKLTTISFLVLQLSAITFIVVCHCMIVKKMKESGEKAGRKTNISRGKTAKFMCITGLNTLSWLSSSIIFTTCLFLETYPVEMISWTVGVVVPLSSLINPILFTVSSYQKENAKDKKPVVQSNFDFNTHSKKKGTQTKIYNRK